MNGRAGHETRALVIIGRAFARCRCKFDVARPNKHVNKIPCSDDEQQ